MQYTISQRAPAETSGKDSDTDADLPMPVAPDISEELEDAELNNHGQWSPLPLEPEDYQGEIPLEEEQDSLAIADLREQVDASSACRKS